VTLVKWGVSIAGIPMVVGLTISLVGSGQGSIAVATNAALQLQQIYVIIFEIDIVAEQKQAYRLLATICLLYNFPLS